MSSAPFKMLDSIAQIAEAFKVRKALVHEWFLEGAPIICITPYSYRADADRLYDWLLQRQIARQISSQPFPPEL